MSFLTTIRKHPSAGLLSVQLLGVVLYPLMESSPRGRAVFGLFGMLVLGLALWVVRKGPWLTWLGVVFALPVFVMTTISTFSPHPTLAILSAALQAVLYVYAAGSLISYMLKDWSVERDDLFAAGATFTLIAWGFAFLFSVSQGLQPGSFGYSDGGVALRSWTELLFLSVAVLSSVGLSDILPVSPMARALVMLESFAGVMYIALVVSRLISLAAANRRESPPP
jgi:hypothetical protein